MVFQVVLVLTVLLKSGQHAYRLADNILQKAGLDFGNLKSGWNEDCQILEVIHTGLIFINSFVFVLFLQISQVLKNDIPTLFINVEKILFMVCNKN